MARTTKTKPEEPVLEGPDNTAPRVVVNAGKTQIGVGDLANGVKLYARATVYLDAYGIMTIPTGITVDRVDGVIPVVQSASTPSFVALAVNEDCSLVRVQSAEARRTNINAGTFIGYLHFVETVRPSIGATNGNTK